LDSLAEALGPLPFVAEDLSVVSDAVAELRGRLKIPGMVVLQCAFDGAAGNNPHHPSNHRAPALCWIGTHDTPTLAAWWAELDQQSRGLVRESLSKRRLPIPPPGVAPISQSIDLCLGSSAARSIVPVQGLLVLSPEGRMNTPGTNSGNWTWRLLEGQLQEALEGVALGEVETTR